jgi:hypothetical protein
MTVKPMVLRWFLCCLIAVNGICSTAQFLTFNRTYGGPGSDDARDIICTPDGGFLMVGTTGSYGPNASDDYPNGYVLKTTAMGEVEWSAALGGSNIDVLNDVELTSNGDLLILGYTYQSVQDLNMLLLRMSPDGTVLWIKRYGSSDRRESGAHMITTGPDEFVIVGGRSQTGGIYSNLLVVKVTAEGDVLWTAEIGPNLGPQDVTIAADGGLLITASVVIVPTFRWGLIKLDSNGGLIWGKVFSEDSGSISASTIIANSDGGCCISGSVGTSTLFVAKLDNLGVFQWRHAFSAGGQSFYPTDLLRTGTGDLVVSAIRYLSDTVFASTLLLLDSTGQQLDHLSYRADQHMSGGGSMLLLDDGSLAVAGVVWELGWLNPDVDLVRIPMSAEGFSGVCHSFEAAMDTVALQEFTIATNVSAEPAPTLSVTALSWPTVPGGTSTLVCTNVSISDHELGSPQIHCFPNPAHDVLTLQPQEGAVISKLVVFDDLGRVVRSAPHDLIHNDLNIRGLDPGHYAVRGSFRSGDLFRVSFIVQ